MSATRNVIAIGLVAVAALLGIQGRTTGQPAGREQPRPEVRGVLKAVDAAARTITVAGSEARESRQPAPDKTYPLTKDVEVALGSDTRTWGVFKPGKLTDLAAGASVTLTLSADQKAVRSILAEGPTVRGLLKAVDAAKRTLTLTMAASRREEGETEKSYTLAPDAEVAVDTGRGRRFAMKEGKLTDLAAGALVTLRLSADQKQVESVLAEGTMISGAVKAVDAGKHTITVALSPGRGAEAGEERTLDVARDAVTLLDDGKGRRLSLKTCKLADVPAGAAATLKLSVDQKVVTLIRAEGPSLPGLIKAVDAAKGTITVMIGRGRGENGEEKTLSVAKDARITIDGREATLADLKIADDGPVALVRLSLDQQTVQAITARQSPR